MRLIDADKLMNYCLNQKSKTIGCNDIARFPTVEAEPIKHGHWDLEDDDWNTYKCSVCGELWTLNAGTPKENNMNYCSNCGAKMDEEA